MNQPVVTLNNGVQIPQLGFGVWQVPDTETAAAVGTALEAGYRSIDTAAIYGNERGTGAAIAASGLPREELFVTTKLWNSDQGRDRTLAGFDASLEKLGLDHVDLYLIHWPAPERDAYLDTWRALGKILADGRARAIGVSNFRPAHLRRLIDETGVVPAVNQVELHPLLQQQELRAFHAEHGIATEAWSPLAQGSLLQHPVLTGIAQRLGRTPAQVILRWHLQQGTIVIPKSVTPERIRQNADVFGFTLDEADMTAVTALDQGDAGRIGPDPDSVN
ncbi:diketogulonate reductase-like aldo/keto reductase [Streptomyces sp. 846.5]|nr:aldo/keto reductase [Streptomyces sp. 846.5]TDT95964.1 diketogulonate reductase-like aldo/keto reductase [Streptomyces sp. 846.5]